MSSPTLLAWSPVASPALASLAQEAGVEVLEGAPAEELRAALTRAGAELLLVVTGPLAPGYVERARALLVETPEVDAVSERWQRRWAPAAPAPLSEGCPPRLAYLLPRNPLLRKPLLARHSGSPADAEFWTAAALSGAKVRALPLCGTPTPKAPPEPESLAQAWAELAASHREAIRADAVDVLVSQEALITDLREYRRQLQAEAAEQKRAASELNARLAAARATLAALDGDDLL